MKNILYIALFLVLAFVSYVVTRAISRSSHAGSSQKPSAAPNDAYLGLRNQALHMSREKIGIPAGSTPTEPWGVIIDWGISSGTTTIVAFADGSASIYLSSGGGYLGGQAQKPIKEAAKNTVRIAADFHTSMKPASEYPLPKQGEARFYILTDAGTFTDSALETDLRRGAPLSKLFGAAQDIISQYRLLYDK